MTIGLLIQCATEEIFGKMFSGDWSNVTYQIFVALAVVWFIKDIVIIVYGDRKPQLVMSLRMNHIYCIYIICNMYIISIYLYLLSLSPSICPTNMEFITMSASAGPLLSLLFKKARALWHKPVTPKRKTSVRAIKICNDVTPCCFVLAEPHL